MSHTMRTPAGTPTARPAALGKRAAHGSRTTRTRRAAAALILATGLATTGCSVLRGDDGSTTLKDFVAALSSEDAEAAAQLTTDPQAAAAALDASLAGMTDAAGAAPDVTADYEYPDDGPAALHVNWKLPPGPDGAPREYSGQGRASLTKVDEQWRIQWEPTVLDTQLGAGEHLAFSELLDHSSRVLAADGSELMHWIPVTHVQIPADPAAPVVDEVAALVGQRHPEITGDSVRAGIDAAQADSDQEGTGGADEAEPSTYTVVTLRADDIAPIREQLAATDQVELLPDQRLVPTGPPSPALSSVQPALEDKLRAAAGWSVRIAGARAAAAPADPPTPGEGTTDPRELAGQPAGAVGDVTTTLDPATQSAAQQAVDGAGPAASIVAIRPSSGEVVAVAQNAQADSYGPVALMGQLPPGSTFKSVTTAAALTAGTIGAQDTVDCPGVVTVSGRTIPNEDEFALGQVPLGTAFARSCNTSQAIISEKLAPEAMQDTAAALGFGVPLQIPGLEVFTGEVPVTEPGPARVEAAIGQGTVTASPFALAELEASLSNGGKMVLPSFFRGEPASTDAQPKPLDPDVVEDIKQFQRQVVTSGTAAEAAGIADLRGKTGTAETGVGKAHGWFVGSSGDLAFCVLIQEADSSQPAVGMAMSFLQGL